MFPFLHPNGWPGAEGNKHHCLLSGQMCPFPPPRTPSASAFHQAGAPASLFLRLTAPARSPGEALFWASVHISMQPSKIWVFYSIILLELFPNQHASHLKMNVAFDGLGQLLFIPSFFVEGPLVVTSVL